MNSPLHFDVEICYLEEKKIAAVKAEYNIDFFPSFRMNEADLKSGEIVSVAHFTGYKTPY